MVAPPARLGVALALLGLGGMALGGCNATARHAPPDGATDIDAGGTGTDAGRGSLDAAGLDLAATDDAGGPRPDAGIDIDAFVGIDAGYDAGYDAGWGTCVSGGVMGTCMSVSTCTGGAPVMGLCPGPADIQCCVPDRDAGPGVDGGPPGTHTVADVLAALGTCTRIGGDYATDVGSTADIPICQTGSVIWWTADMDIDCDGGLGAICMSDPYYMADTSGHDSSGNPLDASTLPFIVIPLSSTRFSYSAHGIALGQVALVMYGSRMAYGIFGDAGPSSAIGEASFAMATALGIPSSPTSGGVDSGVTYLVFPARVTHNEDHAEAVSIGSAQLDTFIGP